MLPTSSNKLLAEWKGPFEIVRRLNKVDYVVRILDKERVYHVNMLKPFYERVDKGQENLNYVSTDETENMDKISFNISNSLSNEQREVLRQELERNELLFSDKPGKIASVSYEN